MLLGRPYVEIWRQCPLFSHVQRICTGDSDYSLACPIPYQFTCPTLCQTMLYWVILPAGAAPVRLWKVDCSQSIFGGDEVMNYREPRRLLGVQDPCCMEVDPQAFPIGTWYLRTIRIKSLHSAVLWMVRRTPYIRLRSLHWVSLVQVGDM